MWRSSQGRANSSRSLWLRGRERSATIEDDSFDDLISRICTSVGDSDAAHFG
jgi:hypothetical protein